MVAHQGEELLIPALIVAVVLLVPMIRHRFGRHPDAPEPGSGVCAYCGAAVGRADDRCASCGFRVTR